MITIERDVLVYLNNQNDWTTSIELASHFGVSIRTIKSTVKSINSISNALIASSLKGYLVKNKQEAVNLIDQQGNFTFPQSFEERRKLIYKKFLLSNKIISLIDLADELSVSETTLLNELNKLKPDLADFDLHFSIKDDFLSIEGYIENKKKLFSRFIYDETKESFLSIDAMKMYLTHFDLEAVKTIVIASLDESHYFIDDFSLFNFILHIGIILERNYQFDNLRQQENTPLENEVAIPEYITNLIENVTQKINLQFNITVQRADKYDLGLLIMTRILPMRNDNSLPVGFEKIISSETFKLMATIQERTLATYGIDMDKGDFKSRFLLHLNSLLTRLRNNIILRNPQMYLIKNMYPFIYDVSVFISNIILQNTKLEILEDEISYIALHIGVLIEETKRSKSKVKALLIYPTYFSQKNHLVDAINKRFSDVLIIQDIVASHQGIQNIENYDLIISSLPSKTAFVIPIVQISNFLSPTDICSISEQIDAILKHRLRSKIESNLNTLFNKRIFFSSHQGWTQVDAIEVLADELHANGYTDQAFKEKIYEREHLSPSDYSNIAMPHPVEMSSLKSGIAVSLHPDGLLWNQRTVYIVFMLAINPDDHLLFRDVFDFITDIIVKPEQFHRLAAAENFDRFIHILLSFVA